MKTAFLVAEKQFEIREIPDPVAPDDGLVLKVAVCGVCGGDVRRWEEGPEINQAFRGKGGNLLGAESLANITGAIAQASQRLQAEGVDLEGYTIPEVVHDLEMARVALGYEKSIYSA